MKIIKHTDPLVVSFVRAVQTGDVCALLRLLNEVPGWASKRAVDNKRGSRTALHVVTDWPGYFPNGPMIVNMLIEAGADIEALGGSIAGGTPLDNVVGYGCWNVARLLVQRGARVDKLWHAAALGMMSRVEELISSNPAPTAHDITVAFWQAQHGGHRRVAEYLLTQRADINGIPGYTSQTALDVAGGLDTRRDMLVPWLKSKGAKSSK